jgi:hypothetical protein
VPLVCFAAESTCRLLEAIALVGSGGTLGEQVGAGYSRVAGERGVVLESMLDRPNQAPDTNHGRVDSRDTLGSAECADWEPLLVLWLLRALHEWQHGNQHHFFYSFATSTALRVLSIQQVILLLPTGRKRAEILYATFHLPR